MCRHRAFLPPTAILVGVISIYSGFRAAADEPEKSRPGNSSGTTDSNVDVQYERARLDLAKLELQIAVGANARLLGVYASATIERLRSNVAISESRLKEVSGGGKQDWHTAHLRELEGAFKMAEQRLKSALEINDRAPGSLPPHEVERLRLRAAVTRLALARAHDPSKVATPLDHLQWQLDQLRDEVLDLSVTVQMLSNRN